MKYVYVDGSIEASDDAVVSAEDRGFLYGDGLFETFRIEGGRLHMLGRHLRRLRESAAMLELTLPDDDVIIGALRATIDANAQSVGVARLTVTRGAGGRLADDTRSATLTVSLRPLLQVVDSHARAALVILGVPHQPPVTPVRTKSVSYLASVLGARETARRGADEGVTLTREGYVAEGTVSNVFIVRAGELLTPPISIGVLPGIARGRVIELAEARGIRVRELTFTALELLDADECFYTNAARGIVPVDRIDDRVLPSKNSVTMMLRPAYDAEIASEEL